MRVFKQAIQFITPQNIVVRLILMLLCHPRLRISEVASRLEEFWINYVYIFLLYHACYKFCESCSFNFIIIYKHNTITGLIMQFSSATFNLPYFRSQYCPRHFALNVVDLCFSLGQNTVSHEEHNKFHDVLHKSNKFTDSVLDGKSVIRILIWS
jgi:hypothetical protein